VAEARVSSAKMPAAAVEMMIVIVSAVHGSAPQ